MRCDGGCLGRGRRSLLLLSLANSGRGQSLVFLLLRLSILQLTQASTTEMSVPSPQSPLLRQTCSAQLSSTFLTLLVTLQRKMICIVHNHNNCEAEIWGKSTLANNSEPKTAEPFLRTNLRLLVRFDGLVRLRRGHSYLLVVLLALSKAASTLLELVSHREGGMGGELVCQTGSAVRPSEREPEARPSERIDVFGAAACCQD